MTDAAITDAMLAEWRATTEAATPGPWIEYRTHRDGKQRGHLCVPGLDTNESGLCVWENMRCVDHQFIATARTAMPLLLDEVERLRAENRTILSGLRWTGDGYEWTGGECDYRLKPEESVEYMQRVRKNAAKEIERLRSELARERAGVRQRDATIMELRNELNRSLPQ